MERPHSSITVLYCVHTVLVYWLFHNIYLGFTVYMSYFSRVAYTKAHTWWEIIHFSNLWKNLCAIITSLELNEAIVIHHRAAHLLLLCGSQTEVVEHLRLQHAQGLQQSRDESRSMGLQTAACCLTDLH